MTTLEAARLAWVEGGWGMWPPLVVLAIAAVTFAERALWFRRSDFDVETLFALLDERLRARDIAGAVTLCTRGRVSVMRVALAGLATFREGRDAVGAAVELAVLREAPRGERRLHWLSICGPVAALTGLLGTLTGAFICSFGLGGSGIEGGPSIDPARLAERHAGGVSEALHCTQFGLMAALVSLGGYAWLRAAADQRRAALDAVAARMLFLADTYRVAAPKKSGP